MTLQKLANAVIRVNDVSEAVDFNVNVFGLTEMAREDDKVYLGCGLDNDYDLVLTSGGGGISQLAYQVMNEDELKVYKRRIEELGIVVDEFTDAEPGHPKKISFLLPATNKDIRMDLVTVAQSKILL